MSIRSSLARLQPSHVGGDDGLEAYRRELWIERGMVAIALDDILDDWLRQGIVNFANQRYGRRGNGR